MRGLQLRRPLSRNGSRSAVFGSPRCEGFYGDLARLGSAANVLAQVEPGDRNGLLTHPVPDKIIAIPLQRHPVPSCNQRPGPWKAKGEIVICHGNATVGIPVSARAHVEQPATRISDNLASVAEAQLEMRARL